ncbi:hypothetical protein LTR56_003006 [Elasticomyces elasticus]|nr:hypothetical protein LTR56_003006 [Elasticomyces elasticus]KAK3662069.1 hypothetical protein LTR22_007041 [Elasticomyces elasticus]KAK4927569.1 hypothetical protein LTR49_005710 [Elasticomyces elasticus]KAK5753218.1 hypothetical protein LTS12_016685 [Elasticomyces elasticus]
MMMYIHWKYTQKLDLNINNLPGLYDLSDQEGYPSHVMRALLWLYVACDVFLDEQAKNAVMNQIIERTDRLMNRCIFVAADHIQYVWENTGPESKLRKYVLETCAAKASPADLSDMTRYPPEFFHELAVLHTRIRDNVPSGLPGLRATMARPCVYHDHADEDEGLMQRSRAEQGEDEADQGSAKRQRVIDLQSDSDEVLLYARRQPRSLARLRLGRLPEWSAPAEATVRGVPPLSELWTKNAALGNLALLRSSKEHHLRYGEARTGWLRMPGQVDA